MKEYIDESSKDMNADLKKFLLLILNPDSCQNPDNYIDGFSKVNDNNLTLQMGYLNGAAYISGIAFNRLIKVRFNYFHSPDSFYVNIDGKDLETTVSIFALKHFFTDGVLLGHPDQPAVVRPTEEMHWYIWESVVLDINSLYRFKLMPMDLGKEISDFIEDMEKSESFTSDLKRKACLIEFEVEKFRDALDEHYAEEHKKDTDQVVDSYR